MSPHSHLGISLHLQFWEHQGECPRDCVKCSCGVSKITLSLLLGEVLLKKFSKKLYVCTKKSSIIMSHILQNFTLLQLKQKGGSYICWQQKLEALLIFFHCQVTKNWRFNSELLPKSEPSRPYILCLGAKNFLLPPPELLLSLGEHLPIII